MAKSACKISGTNWAGRLACIATPRNVSDKGAQELVQCLCGPANKCVKKILWSIDEQTPLEDSAASQFNGIVGEVDESTAIPMVCQEACNFFVARARKKSKEEFEAKEE